MKEMNEVEFMLRIYVMVFYASQRLLNEIRITFHRSSIVHSTLTLFYVLNSSRKTTRIM